MSAIDDSANEGIHTSTITHASSSTDSRFDGLTIANVVATVSDNDQVNTLDVFIDSPSDDAEESPNGVMSLTRFDLEIGDDDGAAATGLRFNGLSIPPQSTITAAYLQFQADEVWSGPTSLTVDGHSDANAETFSKSRRDMTSRPRTSASVGWNPPAWDTIGEAGLDQRTPDLSTIVQEIVDLAGWSSGNSMVFIIQGSGLRVGETFDGGDTPTYLHVEYTTASAMNLSASAAATGVVDALERESLQPIIEAAAALAASNEDELQRLLATPIELVDLPANTLGLARSHQIAIDPYAAGWGWFVDPTPLADTEFELISEGLYAQSESAKERVDLLSVIHHEFGHILGHEHVDGFFEGLLDLGERRVDELSEIPSHDDLDALKRRRMAADTVFALMMADDDAAARRAKSRK